MFFWNFFKKHKQRGDPLELFYGPSLQIELDAPLFTPQVHPRGILQKNEKKNAGTANNFISTLANLLPCIAYRGPIGPILFRLCLSAPDGRSWVWHPPPIGPTYRRSTQKQLRGTNILRKGLEGGWWYPGEWSTEVLRKAGVVGENITISDREWGGSTGPKTSGFFAYVIRFWPLNPTASYNVQLGTKHMAPPDGATSKGLDLQLYNVFDMANATSLDNESYQL